MIKCGHCSNYHLTVDEVRECSVKNPVIENVSIATRFGEVEVQVEVDPAIVAERVAKEQLEEGFYELGDVVFKVVESRAGRLYAKAFVPATGEWSYAPGMVTKLTLDDKLSRETAAKFGRLTGICMICGRKLTNEASIEAGIGPICAERF